MEQRATERLVNVYRPAVIGSHALEALEEGDDHGDADAERVVAALGAHVRAALGGEEQRDHDLGGEGDEDALGLGIGFD